MNSSQIEEFFLEMVLPEQPMDEAVRTWNQLNRNCNDFPSAWGQTDGLGLWT